jgi:hypothetical protein
LLDLGGREGNRRDSADDADDFTEGGTDYRGRRARRSDSA